jgi:hypothetical protein
MAVAGGELTILFFWVTLWAIRFQRIAEFVDRMDRRLSAAKSVHVRSFRRSSPRPGSSTWCVQCSHSHHGRISSRRIEPGARAGRRTPATMPTTKTTRPANGQPTPPAVPRVDHQPADSLRRPARPPSAQRPTNRTNSRACRPPNGQLMSPTVARVVRQPANSLPPQPPRVSSTRQPTHHQPNHAHDPRPDHATANPRPSRSDPDPSYPRWLPTRGSFGAMPPLQRTAITRRPSRHSPQFPLNYPGYRRMSEPTVLFRVVKPRNRNAFG